MYLVLKWLLCLSPAWVNWYPSCPLSGSLGSWGQPNVWVNEQAAPPGEKEQGTGSDSPDVHRLVKDITGWLMGWASLCDKGVLCHSFPGTRWKAESQHLRNSSKVFSNLGSWGNGSFYFLPSFRSPVPGIDGTSFSLTREDVLLGISHSWV